jgi:hypothetical protein
MAHLDKDTRTLIKAAFAEGCSLGYSEGLSDGQCYSSPARNSAEVIAEVYDYSDTELLIDDSLWEVHSPDPVKRATNFLWWHDMKFPTKKQENNKT